jgi:hypothetical protein
MHLKTRRMLMPRALQSARVLLGVNLAVYAVFGLAALFVPG